MPKISEKELNKLAVRGATVRRQQTPEPKPEVATPPPPAPAPVPMASMSASADVINDKLSGIISQNSMVIDRFRTDLQATKNVQPRPLPRRLKVVRDNTRLIDYVDILYEREN